ncbi:hypothetical protein OMK64_08600 [Cellulomonas fimi]|uniref:hypothetical protein n=1 Tax=Cellulomonas fimi TaxID=1708 RepID=UPI00234C3F92|nr:hypothetical protein [Cellulomonas fimi]MDC7121594.1 hypothetical protein [Cellulomonas fimi]
MLRRAAAVVPLSCLLVAGSAAAASAGGSDDPTPYTVTADGLTLPAGRTFVEHDHVNVRYDVDGRTLTAQLHVQAATAQGAFAGRTGLAWTELGLPDRYCVTWVEVSGYNEHFGEGGQRPACTDAPLTAEPVEPIPAVPAGPPEAEPAPAPSATPAPTPSPTVSGAALVATPAPTSSASVVRSEVLSAGAGSGGLAITGSGLLVPVLGLGTAALAAGVVLRSVHRRGRHARPAHRL